MSEVPLYRDPQVMILIPQANAHGALPPLPPPVAKTYLDVIVERFMSKGFDAMKFTARMV